MSAAAHPTPVKPTNAAEAQAQQVGVPIIGCECFSVGTHRGDYYSLSDLDDMARNFTVAKLVLDPPMVAGHEEEQPLVEGEGNSFLDNTGIPAVGWVSKVYRQGTKLLCDFADVLPKIAQLIKAKSYRKVSAEVYDEPPEGVPAECKGKMLRRIAILGGEIPQIKNLSDIPLPTGFSEANADLRNMPRLCLTTSMTQGWRLKGAITAVRKKDTRGAYLRIFSEATMDREAMTTALLAAGWAQENIDKIKDDEVLGIILAQEMSKGAPAAPPADAPPPATDNADMPSPEQMKSELVEMGMAEADLAALTPEDLMKLWQEKKGTPMAEPVRPAAVQTPAAPATPQIPGVNGQPSKVTLQFAEEQARLKADLAATKAEIAAAKKMSEQRLAEEKRATIHAFCERMVKAGKVLPAELHTGDPKSPRPTLVDRLLRADAVKRFSDGPMMGKTELDAQMAEIEGRPELVSFSERMKQPRSAGADDEVARVKRFSETPSYANLLQKKGQTPADVVARFLEAKKKKPALTAAEYFGPAIEQVA